MDDNAIVRCRLSGILTVLPRLGLQSLQQIALLTNTGVHVVMYWCAVASDMAVCYGGHACF